MPIPGVQLKANGNIYPCRLVKLDVTTDFAVIQNTANAKCFGVSQEGTNYPPLSDHTVSTYAAAAGQQVRVFQPGEHCLLEIGDTVTRGDFLKADANGKGVPIGVPGVTQRYGAVALQSGSANEKIQVRVECASES